MKDRKSRAMFRHIPNDENGKKFMEMFIKYRNKEVCGKHYRKYRKPITGDYGFAGNLASSNAKEFSLYVSNFYNPEIDMIKVYKQRDYWKNEFYHQRNNADRWQDEAEENYKSRCGWRNEYYKLHKMSIFQFICYKIKTKISNIRKKHHA